MTVSQAVPIIDHVGNGVSTAFAFDFRIFQALDLVVTVDDVEVTNYTVAITPQPGFGGTVTFTAAPASGAAIRIRRNLPFQRSIDYQQGGDLPEGTLDDDQDAAVMMIQQLAAGSDQRFGAVLRVPDGEAIATLPAAGSRVGRVVGFDNAGQPTLVVPSAGFGLGTNVADEGVQLGSDAVSTINFAGDGVQAQRSGATATVTIPGTRWGPAFANDWTDSDIVKFSVYGGAGAAAAGEGGGQLNGWTISNIQGNGAPFGSTQPVFRRLTTTYGTAIAWGARTTSTVFPVKIRPDGLGDFQLALDFGRAVSQAWDGQFFMGATDGTLAASPIENQGANYVGFMRPSALGNYRVATRVASGAVSYIDTGIGLGANDGSVIYRFIVGSLNGNAYFQIWQFNATTNRFDTLLYSLTLTSGLPTVALAPGFGGPAAQNVSVIVWRFSGWARA